MIQTTDQLVARIRIKGGIADNDPDYDAETILAEADDVITERLVEVISSLRQGLYVVSQDIPLVANQLSYVIPGYAAANALEGVTTLQADGKERPMIRYDASDISWTTGNTAGQSSAYVVVGDSVVLGRPPIDATESLRVRYTCRRSKMVPVAQTAMIADVDFVTYHYLVIPTADIPAEFGAIVGLTYDIVSSTYPYGVVQRAFTADFLATSGSDKHIGSTTIDVTEGVPSADVTAGLSEGDYLALSGQTPLVQIPFELRPALANATAGAILLQKGFKEDAQAAFSMADRGIASYKALAAPRVKNTAVKLINRNSPMRTRGQ